MPRRTAGVTATVSHVPVPLPAMMPTGSIQSRIQAFEVLSSSSSTTPTTNDRVPSSSLLESPISPTASAFHPITPFVAPTCSNSNRSRSPSPSTPSLAGKASLIDLKDWIVEDGPVEQPTTRRHTLTSRTGKLNGIPESSVTSPTKVTPPRGIASSSTPLIHFQPPTKPRPPLPPRKPSLNTSDRISTQHSVSAGSETSPVSRTPGCSDTLTIEHTYPPGAHKFGASRVGHAPTSSFSSFHSVSLSSDGSNVEMRIPSTSPMPPSFVVEADNNITDFDTASIAESFENVSAPPAASPSITIPFDWEHATGQSKTPSRCEPPNLPHRPGTNTTPAVPPKPLARSVSASSSSTATSTKTRRPPPPPPPYQPRSRPSSSRASVVSISASTSDRSSILSNVTTTSRTSVSTRNSAQVVKSSSLLRPTPVPLAARSRYELLFDSALQGRRKAEKKTRKVKLLAPPPLPAKKSRQAAGWRGLSVDLITNPEDHPGLAPEKRSDESDSEEKEESSSVGTEKLNGRIVKYIWSASRLDREKLRSIWNECDPQRTGSLDRDAFVRGMWRVDEELRRAQLARRTSALAAASSQRIPHRPLLPKPQILQRS